MVADWSSADAMISNLKANVIEWIKRNGRRSSLKRITQGAYDPQAGEVAESITEIETYCVFYTRRVNSIAQPMNTIPNTFVMKAMIDITPLDSSVTTADRIVTDNGEWTIQRVEELLAPDGSVMAVQCEVSRL